jgi:RNA polymerase-binding transcription factor
MQANELRKWKKLLAEARAKLQLPVTSNGAVIPGASSFEGDILDQASADFESELYIELHRTDGRRLNAIDQALSRIKLGTYGVCMTCKRPISKARLAAVPWTPHCRHCKELEHT